MGRRYLHNHKAPVRSLFDLPLTNLEMKQPEPLRGLSRFVVLLAFELASLWVAGEHPALAGNRDQRADALTGEGELCHSE